MLIIRFTCCYILHILAFHIYILYIFIINRPCCHFTFMSSCVLHNFILHKLQTNCINSYDLINNIKDLVYLKLTNTQQFIVLDNNTLMKFQFVYYNIWWTLMKVWNTLATELSSDFCSYFYWLCYNICFTNRSGTLYWDCVSTDD